MSINRITPFGNRQSQINTILYERRLMTLLARTTSPSKDRIVLVVIDVIVDHPRSLEAAQVRLITVRLKTVTLLLLLDAGQIISSRFLITTLDGTSGGRQLQWGRFCLDNVRHVMVPVPVARGRKWPWRSVRLHDGRILWDKRRRWRWDGEWFKRYEWYTNWLTQSWRGIHIYVMVVWRATKMER